MGEWIEQFSAATLFASRLARAYLEGVRALRERWRHQLAALPSTPRADAAAWAVIEILPAHPLITAAVAVAATGRAKAAIYQAFAQLKKAGVLLALSDARRNLTWEAAGLLDLIVLLEAGQPPPPMTADDLNIPFSAP
ncbi:MAG: hypothetical protein ACREON_04655 [Gemmatimonadaceae bacterium]